MEKPNHTRLGIPGSLYKPLSNTDVKKIVDSALEILDRSGMAVYSPTA